MAQGKGVLIFGELADGRLAGITTELLGVARKLGLPGKDLGVEVAVVFLGEKVRDSAGEAIFWGADKVYTVEDTLLKSYLTEPYVMAMEGVCRQLQPDVLLIGQTTIGRDLAPRLAFRLGTGLAMDCVDLAIDPQSRLLQQSRPVYGGNARGVFACPNTRPQMATVRVKAMSPLPRDASRKGDVIPLKIGLDPSKVKAKLAGKVKQEAVGIKLEEAPVVVSGGRGIGSADGFKQLEELARLLGGAVGATRAATDAGYAPASLQVGLTGKIVTPDLYFAIALSGSSQHMAGCSGSKAIVAINKDPEANIFKESRYGIVADYRQVLPTLIEKVKELKAK